MFILFMALNTERPAEPQYWHANFNSSLLNFHIISSCYFSSWILNLSFLNINLPQLEHKYSSFCRFVVFEFHLYACSGLSWSWIVLDTKWIHIFQIEHLQCGAQVSAFLCIFTTFFTMMLNFSSFIGFFFLIDLHSFLLCLLCVWFIIFFNGFFCAFHVLLLLILFDLFMLLATFLHFCLINIAKNILILTMFFIFLFSFTYCSLWFFCACIWLL